MAAALRESFPAADVTLTASGGGVFEVRLDGALVYSKKQLGRHPQPGEVLALLRAKMTKD